MNLQYVCKLTSAMPGIMPSVSIPSIIKHEWRIKMKCQTCIWHKNSRFAKNKSKQTLAKTQKEINLCNIKEGIKCYQATNQWLWVTNRNLSNSTILSSAWGTDLKLFKEMIRAGSQKFNRFLDFLDQKLWSFLSRCRRIFPVNFPFS